MKKTLSAQYDCDGSISVSIDERIIAYGFTKAAAQLFCQGITHGLEVCGCKVDLTDDFFFVFN